MKIADTRLAVNPCTGTQIPHQQPHPSSSNSAPQASTSTTSSSNANPSQSTSSSSSATPAPFQPITLKQVMSAHGNDIHQALSGLLGNFNVALQDRESDKLEKTRLNNENSKLWSWSNSLKRERDANMKEIRTLCARVVELEKILSNEGISIPPPPQSMSHYAPNSSQVHPNLLSPSDSYTANSEIDHANQRRPQPGPRSASDNGGNVRERQTSNRSERERERSGTVTLPASHSMNSFTTASSMDSLPSYTSSSRSGADRDRRHNANNRAAGASTPPVIGSSKSLTPQSHNSPFIGASPPSNGSRSREHTSSSNSNNTSLPPLSSSASFTSASNPSSHHHLQKMPSSAGLQQSAMVGLATIPSTPVLNSQDRIFALEHGGGYTNSPTADSFQPSHPQHHNLSTRERETSDSNSIEHLRIAKSSPLPSSPALSSHSAGSSSFNNKPTSHHSGTGSQQPSPRSPRFARDVSSSANGSGSGSPYILEGPTQGSPRHPNFHPPTAQTQSRSQQQQQYPSNTTASASTANVPRRTLSRKASSLDLGNDTKSILPQVPSRSATPPPDLGSPKTSSSPVQYAAYDPKTPPVNFDARFAGRTPGNVINGNRAGMGVAQGTPLMDLPDEARHWILANGSGLPSPVNSLDQRNERDRTAASLTSQVSP